MKGSQEVRRWKVTDVIQWKKVGVLGKQSLVLLDISLIMGICWAGHWMSRRMCIDEMQLMVWVSCEWSHDMWKGVASVDAYTENIGYLNISSVWETGKF